jgi:hypothetical protein
MLACRRLTAPEFGRRSQRLTEQVHVKRDRAADAVDDYEAPDDEIDESLDDAGELSAASDDGDLPADVEQTVAATLALMTSFYRCPHVAVCRKLLDNLALLSRHPQLSEPLRMVCRNAGARWASYLEEVEQAIAEAGTARDADDDAAGDEDEAPPVTLH